MSTMLEPQPEIIADAVLMSRLARRDSTALVELERRHRASLYAQAYGTLMDAIAAARVVQDAFAQVWFIAADYSGNRRVCTLLRYMAKNSVRAERAWPNSPVRRG